MSNKSAKFTHLAINTMRKKSGEIYQARLSAKYGRQTIGLGSDYVKALNLAKAIDERISQFLANSQPIDLDALKALVNDANEASKPDVPKVITKGTISQLWDDYVAFHVSLGAWEETYIRTHIDGITRLLAKSPYQRLEDKQKLVSWIFEDKARSPKTSKDRFKLIVAGIDWASKQGLIPRSWGIEYRDLLENVSKATKRASSDDERSVDIFSVREVYIILQALETDAFSRFTGKHSQYHKYVYFCWLCGCRPSEAIALKWENIDLNKGLINFCEGEVLASGKVIRKEGTKTVKSRIFPINEELRSLLGSIPHRQGYVFRNALGKPISQQAFNGVWKTVLKAAGIPYRVPYQLRHTMISYHANNDFPLHKLSELVGNSEKILTDRYLKLDIERISLPDVIKP